MYNSMKENLMEYLAKFAQNGKVVREEDIKQFFEVKCSAFNLVHFYLWLRQFFQCCVTGTERIHTDLALRIRIGNADPDSGDRKLIKILK